jgi:glycosidase
MEAGLEQRNSRNAPDIGTAVAQIRAAAPDALLVGEVYLLSDRLAPYLEHLDACFSFELLHAPWQADKVRTAIAAAAATGQAAWVLSNHDFPRLPDRVGARNVRAAALLLLTLPGMAFVYQGDELGLADGPDQRHDRAGRDRHRHPMPWDGTPNAGFTSGTPWLSVEVPADGPASEQHEGSMLDWYRSLIALRRELSGELELLDGGPDVVAFRRGEHVIALNLGAEQSAPPLVAGAPLLATAGATQHALPPGGAIVSPAT